MNTVMMMIANVAIEDAATALQAAGIDATIQTSVGVGAWGMEYGVTVTLAGDAVATAYRAIEEVAGIDEEAVYVVDLGRPGKVIATSDL